MGYVEIFALAASAILTAILKIKWSEANALSKWALIIGIITFLVVAFNSCNKLSKEELKEKVEAKIGEINDPTLAYETMIQIGPTGPTFEVGYKGLMVDSAGNPLLKVYIKNSRLCVYAIVRDTSGNDIAVIDDNVWTLFDDKYEYEYNNDKRGFELVTKAERKVFFQLYLKAGIVHFQGMLCTKNGWGSFWQEHPTDRGAILNSFIPNKPEVFLDNQIKRLFKYPRGWFFSERVD